MKILFVIVCIIFMVSVCEAVPRMPISPDEVLVKVKDTELPRELRQLRQQLSEQLIQTPDDLETVATIIRQAMLLGRQRGEPRYIGFSAAAVQRFLSRFPSHIELQLLHADVLQYDHKFTAARQVLDGVVALAPNNIRARLQRASILHLQANYDAALRDCRSLLLRADALIATTCLAQTAGLTGQADSMFLLLARRLDLDYRERDASHAWSYGVLAELAERRGDADLAQTYLRAGLSIETDNPYLLATYADHLLKQNRHNEVLALLSGAPRNVQMLLRLARAEQAVDTPARYYTRRLRDAVAQLNRLNDRTHLRELAAFYLYVEQKPEHALLLAQQNWKVQKAPEDAKLLLLAAHAAGQSKAANSVFEWVNTHQIIDPAIDRLLANLQGMST